MDKLQQTNTQISVSPKLYELWSNLPALIQEKKLSKITEFCSLTSVKDNVERQFKTDFEDTLIALKRKSPQVSKIYVDCILMIFDWYKVKETPSSEQIVEIASIIMNKYLNWTFADLVLFVHKCKTGDLLDRGERVLNRLDGAMIISWANKYDSLKTYEIEKFQMSMKNCHSSAIPKDFDITKFEKK